MDWLLKKSKDVQSSLEQTIESTTKQVTATSGNVLDRVGSLVKKDEPAFPTFCITFRSPDLISVLHAEEDVEKMLHDTLNEMRRGAVERTVDTANEHAVVFQVKGDPFTEKCDKDEVIHIRRVTCSWLEKLAALGWKPMCSADLSVDDGLTSWFFEYTGKPKEDPDRDVIALAIQQSDLLILINNRPPLVPALQDSVGDHAQKVEKTKTGDFTMKIRGNPWDPTALNAFDDGMKGRRILLEVFKNFAAQNYQFYGHANLQGVSDTIMFVKEPRQEIMRFAMLSLNGKDKIRFLDMPEKHRKQIHKCIAEHWTEGVQSTDEYEEYNAFEYKLKGCPWNCRGDEALRARILIANLLQCLHQCGWGVEVALDLSADQDDKSVFVLRPITTTGETDHVCLAPVEKNKLHLINAPRDMLIKIKETVRSMLKTNVESERLLHNEKVPESLQMGCYEWTIKGSPWACGGKLSEDGIMARHVITVMLAVMKKMGWRPVASADISAIREMKGSPSDTHTLFFRYDSKLVDHQ